MDKPQDIPQDVWDAALIVAERINVDATTLHGIIVESAARGMMSERQYATDLENSILQSHNLDDLRSLRLTVEAVRQAAA